MVGDDPGIILVLVYYLSQAVPKTTAAPLKAFDKFD